MFFKKKKKELFNIALCVHSAVLSDSLKKYIYENPEAEHIEFRIVNESYYGRQCLNYVRKYAQYIDLIIVDADIEDEFDGYEVCRMVREKFPNMPLLLISKEKKKMLQAKDMYYIDEVLLHPYQPSYLWMRINNIVRNKRQGVGNK